VSQPSGRTVSVVVQRRRTRAGLSASAVGATNARPAALRELYLDAGSRIRRSAPSVTRASQS